MVLINNIKNNIKNNYLKIIFLMAALSIVICNKNARIIFARQFFSITRMDLEEYIVQFSRGVDSCKEITHFESDKIRYIFIPI